MASQGGICATGSVCAGWDLGGKTLALGCRSIDKERVAEIVRLVRLDAWVDELPQGMDTPLGEGGGRLSGGRNNG